MLFITYIERPPHLDSGLNHCWQPFRVPGASVLTTIYMFTVLIEQGGSPLHYTVTQFSLKLSTAEELLLLTLNIHWTLDTRYQVYCRYNPFYMNTFHQPSYEISSCLVVFFSSYVNKIVSTRYCKPHQWIVCEFANIWTLFIFYTKHTNL